MGAVLGRATPLQLVVMCMVEMVFYGLNRQILLTELSIGDIGGSLVIHGFGGEYIRPTSRGRASRRERGMVSADHKKR